MTVYKQHSMNKLKIEDPQTFQFASAVIKQSKTGFSSNRRLLVVRGGHLYYFSNIPSFFDGNPKTLEYHHQLPKHSIEILNIKKIKPFQATSCTFEIVFDQMYLMEREDIRKTLVESLQFQPKKRNDELIWRFTCDNNPIKHKWVSFLAQLREHFLREKEKMEKYFWNMQAKSEHKSSTSNLSSKSSKAPWRESTVMRKQYNNDFKSVGDLTGTQMDLYFQHPVQGLDQNRLTSSYVPRVDMENFGLQSFNQLTMTDPGIKREIKMKKLGSTDVGAVKY